MFNSSIAHVLDNVSKDINYYWTSDPIVPGQKYDWTYPYTYYYPTPVNHFKIAVKLVEKGIVKCKDVNEFIELVKALEKEI
jgi:hypothetical protein